MYDGLEFRHLASFVSVAEECSFSKAAERLNISQPSLSAQIKQVENGLRANLFIRSQTGASLTRSGAQFLVFARQMLHMRDDAVRATSSDQTGTEWPLRFGYSPFADHKLVDEALSGYQELVPGGLIQSSSECSAEPPAFESFLAKEARPLSVEVGWQGALQRRFRQRGG
jgi:DNA-binding transcriptional LysR family regulator